MIDFVPMLGEVRLQVPAPAMSDTVHVAPAPSDTLTRPDGTPPVEVTDTETV